MAAKTGRGLAQGSAAARINRTNIYAELTVNDIDITSVEAAAEENPDTTNGNEFNNGTQKKVFLQARNSGASQRTLTVQIPGEIDVGVPNNDRDITIEAGDTLLIGSFAPSIYNWGGTNLVRLLASHAEVKLIAYRLT